MSLALLSAVEGLGALETDAPPAELEALEPDPKFPLSRLSRPTLETLKP